MGHRQRSILKVALQGAIVSCEAVAGRALRVQVPLLHVEVHIGVVDIAQVLIILIILWILVMLIPTGASASFVSLQNNRRDVSGTG